MVDNSYVNRIISLSAALDTKLRDRKHVIVYTDQGGLFKTATRSSLFSRIWFRLTHHTFRSATLIRDYRQGLNHIRDSDIRQIKITGLRMLFNVKPLVYEERSVETQWYAGGVDQFVREIREKFDGNIGFWLKKNDFDSADANALELAISGRRNDILRTRGLKDLNLVSCKGILEANGLNLILNSTSDGQPINTYVCKNIDALDRAVEHLKGINFMGKIAFLIFSNKFGEDSGDHVTPLLVERTPEKIQVCILDSVGKRPSKGSYSEYKNILEKGISRDFLSAIHIYSLNVQHAVLSVFPNAMVYSVKSQRQHDDNTCSIFSLNDVKHFFRDPKFFKTIENDGQLEERQDDQDFAIFRLPPAHMKLTQSKTQLDAYLKSLPEGQAKQKLIGSLEKSYRTWGRGGKQTNEKARFKMLKYQHLINQCLVKFTDDELREKVSRHDSSRLKTIS